MGTLPLHRREVFWALLGLVSGLGLHGLGILALAWFWLALGVLGILAGLAGGRDHPGWWSARVAQLLTVACFAGFGWWRESAHQAWLDRDPVRDYAGMTVDCSGRVLEPARPAGTRVRFRFYVERVEGHPRIKPFPVLVELGGLAEALPAFATGERWRMPGRLVAFPGPAYPGAFDRRAHARRYGIHHRLEARVEACEFLDPPSGWTPQALSSRLRMRLLDALTPHFARDQRGLLAGILLGETSELSHEVESDFRDTGTSHLLAASGLNVGIIVGLVMLVGRRIGFSYYQLSIPGMLATGMYCLVAGCSPSVVRAAAMAGFALLAMRLGRRTDLLQVFLLGCFACLAVDPGNRTDVGFQLSVLAVVGILVYAQDLSDRLVGPRWLRLQLGATVAAGLTTLPFLWWEFGQLAPATLIANLLMAPVAELLLPLGLATAGVAALSDTVCSPLVSLLHLGLGYLITTADILASRAPALAVSPPAPEFLLGWLGFCAALRMAMSGMRGATLVAVISLVTCLVGCLPARPTTSSSLIIRHAPGLGGTMVWVSAPPRAHAVLLSREHQLRSAQDMLRRHGVLGPDWIVDMSQQGTGAFRLGEARLVVEHGTARIFWHRFTWAWGGGSPYRLQSGKVELHGDTWDLSRDGALQLECDGRMVRWGPWR